MLFIWGTLVSGTLAMYFYKNPEIALPFDPSPMESAKKAGVSFGKLGRRKLLLIAFSFGLITFVVTRSITMLVIFPAAVYVGFEFVQKRREKNRKNLLRKGLLAAIELLWIPCDSGLSFRESVVRLSADSNNPVIKEIKRCYDEIAAGKRREVAYRDLVKRTSPEVESLIRAVSYTEEMGEPISNFLERETERIHMEKRAKIQEVADRIGDRILIIVIAVMGPAFFILLFAPIVSRFGFLTAFNI